MSNILLHRVPLSLVTVFKPIGPKLFLILTDIPGMQSHAGAQTCSQNIDVGACTGNTRYTNRGFWWARSREPPYRMNAGCFPNPNQKKSVSFVVSFWFVGWGCSGLGLARIFANPKPSRTLWSLEVQNCACKKFR